MKFFIPLLSISLSTIANSSYAASTLTFSEVLTLARQNALELKRAENSLRAAQNELKSIDYKDDIKLTTYTSGTLKYSNPASSSSASTKSAVKAEPGNFDALYGIQGNVTVYDFGRTEAEKNRANLFVEEKNQTIREQEEYLSMRVSRAYAKFLGAESLADLARQQLKNATQKFSQVRNNYNQGLRPEYDFARAESDLGRASIAEKKSRDELFQAYLQLQMLMGNSTVDQQIPRASATLAKSDSNWRDIEKSISKDLAAAALITKRIQRSANIEELKSIDARLLPTLSASAGATWTRGTSLPETKDSGTRSAYSGAIILSWDIPCNQAYSNDKLRIAIRDRDLDLAEQIEIRTRSEKSLATISRIDSLISQSSLTKKQTEYSARNLSIVKQKYDVGKASATELSSAEDENITAQTDSVRTQIQIYEAIIDLAEQNGNTNIGLIFTKD